MRATYTDPSGKSESWQGSADVFLSIYLPVLAAAYEGGSIWTVLMHRLTLDEADEGERLALRQAAIDAIGEEGVDAVQRREAVETLFEGIAANHPGDPVERIVEHFTDRG